MKAPFNPNFLEPTKNKLKFVSDFFRKTDEEIVKQAVAKIDRCIQVRVQFRCWLSLIPADENEAMRTQFTIETASVLQTVEDGFILVAQLSSKEHLIRQEETTILATKYARSILAATVRLGLKNEENILLKRLPKLLKNSISANCSKLLDAGFEDNSL